MQPWSPSVKGGPSPVNSIVIILKWKISIELEVKNIVVADGEKLGKYGFAVFVVWKICLTDLHKKSIL